LAINDTYQLTLISKLDTQTALNVFHYFKTDTGDGTAEDLVDTFVDVVQPSIAAIMSGSSGIFGIDCFNINNLGDFFSLAESVGGTVSGDVMPVFVTNSFKYLRTTRAVRNGAKRIVGVPESGTTDGVNPTSGYATLLAACATAMAADLFGALDQYDPCIFHKTSPAGEPLAGTPHAISGVAWSHFGSQNTRKLGRGI